MTSTNCNLAIGPDTLAAMCGIDTHLELARAQVEKAIGLINAELVRRGGVTNSYITVDGSDGGEPSDWDCYYAEILLGQVVYDGFYHELISKYMNAGWKSVQIAIANHGTIIIHLYRHRAGGATPPEAGIINIRPDDSVVITGLDKLPKFQ